MTRMNYISKIQASLKRYKTIHTRKTTSRVIDGSYNSIYKGRSLNFDELREYVAGDEVKDIDWKASARSGKVLVRQYIAEKKHNIMLVFDANRRMLADTENGHEKREMAILSGGTLAYLVNSNGEYVSALYTGEKGLKMYPFRTGLANIENILNNYHNDVSYSNTSSLNNALEYIVRTMRRKTIIIVVTDMQGMREVTETTLKRLLLMNDVMFINVSDGGMSGKNVYDIGNNNYMPSFLTRSKRLARLEKQKKDEILADCDAKFKKYGVSMTTVDDPEEMDTKLIELLEKHKVEMR